MLKVFYGTAQTCSQRSRSATRSRCEKQRISVPPTALADQYSDAGPTDQESHPSTPFSAAFDADSNSTEFQAPLLVAIEADDRQLYETIASRSASSAWSAIDLVVESEPSPLSEFRARHIALMAEQRARR